MAISGSPPPSTYGPAPPVAAVMGALIGISALAAPFLGVLLAG